MGGRLNLDGGTLNLDGETLTLDGPPASPLQFKYWLLATLIKFQREKAFLRGKSKLLYLENGRSQQAEIWWNYSLQICQNFVRKKPSKNFSTGECRFKIFVTWSQKKRFSATWSLNKVFTPRVPQISKSFLLSTSAESEDSSNNFWFLEKNIKTTKPVLFSKFPTKTSINRD